MGEFKPSPDLDLRVVRYFVAVAEHAHFGRAAAALHVGQPTLSRQIRDLEQQLGVRLLDRTAQGAQLSEAGEAFLPKARALLRAAAEATAAARNIPGHGSLTVGYSPGLVVTPVVREFRGAHPGVTVRTMYLGWRRPAEVLLNRQVDVAVVRLPFPTAGLHITPLHDEPRLLVVPRGHRLAGRAFVTMEDIADEPMPWVPDLDPDVRAFWRLEPRPDGHVTPAGPSMPALDDTWELVASGQTLAVVALSHGQLVRPDLELIPLRGIAPSKTVLATRADDGTKLVAGFVRCATTHEWQPAGRRPASNGAEEA
ncbi:LysR substrate-binding domain-containing protein [Amycolatopsis sp. NPDC059021]|uniref:LysR substrate-binding domain-containing protein n=1 Tax=Amycolatopsis sp. NPDC059021 TaxID=3346704 RepID=UPI00366C11A7